MPAADRGQESLGDFLDKAEGHPGFARACLVLTDGDWKLQHLDAVIGEQLPRERPVVWRYEDVVFVAAEVTGEHLRACLRTERDGTLTLGAYSAVVPEVSATANYHREPSLARYSTPRLLWPHTVYEVSTTGNQTTDALSSGHLVGEDCPSFPSFEHAVQAFFTGEVSLARGPSAGSNGLARIRVVETEARLAQVTVTPTHVNVVVQGADRQGTRVDINGSTAQESRRVGVRGRVRLPLADGLPEDAWLYLSRGGRWLDYRALGTAFGGVGDDGVDLRQTSDPAAEIRALLSVGEGPTVEYKRQLPDGTLDSKRKVLKTVAAFANGDGGHIIFGMDPDETTLVGLGDLDAKEARDRLGRLIRGNVVPPDPSYGIDAVDLHGKHVIALRVERSGGRPYGLRFQDRPVEFYVRRGSSTFPATAEEVRSLAQRPTPGPYPWA